MLGFGRQIKVRKNPLQPTNVGYMYDENEVDEGYKCVCIFSISISTGSSKRISHRRRVTKKLLLGWTKCISLQCVDNIWEEIFLTSLTPRSCPYASSCIWFKRLPTLCLAKKRNMSLWIMNLLVSNKEFIPPTAPSSSWDASRETCRMTDFFYGELRRGFLI